MNKSIIVRTANYLSRSMTRSQAFKKAWQMIKGKVIEKVAGVTKEQRQTAIEHLTHYDISDIEFTLERERDNRFDPNAIAVIASVKNKGSYKIGYIPSKTAQIIAPILDKGICLKSALKSIVGGVLGLSYGLRIEVRI